ncbi:MAG: hypothetical protein ACLP4R_23340 [Solirubrobacteraceae bacterium]
MVELTGDVVRNRPARLIVEAAVHAFATLPGAPRGLAAGSPELVLTPDGEPSYWLVTGHGPAGVQAIARVLLDGHVATVGASPPGAEDAGAAVTGLSRARAELARPPDAVEGPILVHDGPVAREAWLYVAVAEDGHRRWVFTTAGGSYERPAGVPLGGGPST